MSSGKIVVLETGIRIFELEVPSRDVAEYLRALPEEQREQAVVHVVRVGVFCLERARVGQDFDFAELPRTNQPAGTPLATTSTDRTEAPAGVAGHPAHEPIPLLGPASAPPASVSVEAPGPEETHQT
jgi:hypothetical protein